MPKLRSMLELGSFSLRTSNALHSYFISMEELLQVAYRSSTICVSLFSPINLAPLPASTYLLCFWLVARVNPKILEFYPSVPCYPFILMMNPIVPIE